MILDLPERFVTVDIKVDGEQIIAPVVADLTIEEIGEDMDMVAAQMGYWGNVLAAAEEAAMAADAAYRSWRGNLGTKLLEDNAKLGEWKVKQLVDASPQFLEHKAAIAKAQRAITVCDRVFQAFAKKANVLQSRGATERSVLERTGIVIKGDPGVATAAQEKRERRKDRVRNIFSRRTRQTEEPDTQE
jgi:hypothetical protein